MIEILKSYLKKLTNLTSNNRSIYLPRIVADKGIDLNAFDYAINKSAYQLLEEIIIGKNSIKLCNYIDSRDASTNDLSKKLIKIDRTNKHILEERGANDLYLGFPFVHGQFLDGTLVRCPIILFPLELEFVNNGQSFWNLVKRKDSLPVWNKSFLIAYAHHNKIKLTDDFIDMQFEENFADILVFKNFLYELLKQSNVEINFNQDLFLNTVQIFESVNKSIIESNGGLGQLKLQSEAVIGFFSQAGSLLAEDYNELIENNQFENLEQFFETNTLPTATNIITKEENLLAPFALDASQELAMQIIKSGKSLVIQGPPGTGKSQLICNLAADYIAKGKKILIVCQKRAALDVVHQRLEQVGIKNFLGLVHDFRNDQKNLYQQITHQIDEISSYQQINNSLDAIWIEREFLLTCRSIDKIIDELDELKHAIFDETLYGISVKTMYLCSKINSPKVEIRTNTHINSIDSLQILLKKISDIVPYLQLFASIDSGWENRKKFNDFVANDKSKVAEILKNIYPEAQKYISQFAALGLQVSFAEILRFESHANTLKILNDSLADKSVAKIFEFVFTKSTQIEIGQSIVALESYLKLPFENTLSNEELPIFKQFALDAQIKFQRIDYKIIWHLFSKSKQKIRDILFKNNLTLNKQGLISFLERLNNRALIESETNKLFNLTGYESNLNENKLEILGNLILLSKKSIELSTILSDQIVAKLKINGFLSSLKRNLQVSATLEKIAYVAAKVAVSNKEWSRFLNSEQIESVVNNKDKGGILSKILHTNFDTFVEYDGLIENLAYYEKDILKQLSIFPTENMVDICRNSFYLEWIDAIENKFPILRSVSTPKMEQLESNLHILVANKQELSKDIVLLKLREQTYKNIEFNRLNNQTTYRELRHQTSKKKKIWKLRKTIAEFKTEVFQLIPCWLASAETVSAIFPMHELFDLVIFDEASQCYVEKSLPAIVRGKQITIVGDDKQLPPNDLYQPRWDEDENSDSNPDLEIDSLLNLAEKYLPQTMLMGHYRSCAPELIAFSNKYFYNNKLQLIPNLTQINSKIPAIDVVKINGIWHNNSNLEEAKTVVDLIMQLSENEPNKSIGVVTFNAKQQELIADMLDQVQESKNWKKPAKLFVKNIENVQGDERDVIIFSIGYAPDINGTMQMQFGSLSQVGGENRLNVAITRARQKIYITTSIEPQQLKVDDSKNEGPKLLKAYLEYAKIVSSGNYKQEVIMPANYKNESYLKNKICQYAPNALPFADMAEITDLRYSMLVLTDDDLYFNATSAKETFAYIPRNLLEKQWTFKRIFSRNYWKDT